MMKSASNGPLVATVRVLGNSADGRANGVLRSVLDDKKLPIGVRREAVRSIAKSRNGALELASRAKAQKVETRLKQAVAAALHGAQWRDVKEQANKLLRTLSSNETLKRYYAPQTG